MNWKSITAGLALVFRLCGYAAIACSHLADIRLCGCYSLLLGAEVIHLIGLRAGRAASAHSPLGGGET